MTMVRNLLRFVRRKHHTIVSTEIIKPSFPTPSHLKTYNLSPADQFVPSSFMPMVTFYPKNDTYHSPHDQVLDLKNSLSQTLTKYYPLAGRHARIAPTYVDCNDHGAAFVEASMGTTLSHFLQNSQHEDLDQLFPYGRVWRHSNSRPHDNETDTVTPLMVKASRFECGGVAVAVSLSHKIADACSMIHFFNDWAELNQVCSKIEKCEVLIEPDFIPFEHTNINIPEFSPEVPKNCVTRSFIFPNAKLNALKLKVKVMNTGTGQRPISSPTRVEVLTWLLYKCAVAAATKNNSGSFKPSSILVMANLRDKMMETLPMSCIGNFVKGLVIQTTSEREMKPEMLLGELRRQKMGIRDLKNYEAFFSLLSKYKSDGHRTKIENGYLCSSICCYPSYGIDFGWGIPIKATLPGNLGKNSFLLMDTANKEGIEAIVCLKKQDMDIVERDPELLAFCY